LSVSKSDQIKSITTEAGIDFDAGALASSVLDSVINSTSTIRSTISSPIKATTKKVR